MADPKVDRLSQVPLFRGLSNNELQFLASRIDQVPLEPGETVIHEGQPTEAFFILVSGHVQVTRQGKPTARLGPGDFFGEIGMLDNGPATATVVAEDGGDALILSHAQFRDAIRGNDKLALQVIAAMAERLRANSLA